MKDTDVTETGFTSWLIGVIANAMEDSGNKYYKKWTRLLQNVDAE